MTAAAEVEVSEGEDFDELGRELRDRVGEDFRSEAEEGERLAAQAARRKRSLADVARERLLRGDHVVVGVAGRRFNGVVLHAAGDLMSLEAIGAIVHVNLSRAYLRVANQVRQGGGVPGEGPASFVALLRQLELEATPVELGSRLLDGGPLGVIRVVATDHVVLDDADHQQWYIPTAEVGYVAVRRRGP